MAQRSVPIIRPTQALWKAWGGKGRLPDVEIPTPGSGERPCRLCNWFAREVAPLGKPMVLAAEASTMLTLLLPMAELSMSMVIFREALERELRRLRIPLEAIASEVAALEELTIAKNNDRSTMGSLTRFAFELEYMAQFDVERGRPVDLDELQLQLNRTPHVQREESFAEDAVRGLFGI